MDTVRINTYPSGARAITLNAERVFALNDGLLEEMGKTLFDLAEEDPTAAYDYLRRGIGYTASQHTIDISENKRLTAVHLLDGPEATGQIAEATILRCLPPSYEGPFQVAVYVIGDEVGPIPEQGAPSELFRLDVQPPDLS